MAERSSRGPSCGETGESVMQLALHYRVLLAREYHREDAGDEDAGDRGATGRSATRWARPLAWPVPAARQALGEGRRLTSAKPRPTRPTTINASGIGHHQCSQKAPSPCTLSRPAQKTPRSRKTAPTIWPIRRMVQGYPCVGRPCQEPGPVAQLTRRLPLPRSRALPSIGCAVPRRRSRHRTSCAPGSQAAPRSGSSHGGQRRSWRRCSRRNRPGRRC